MRTVVFDILGKFAHFRVFYANANALTYSFPPRTTLAGMIAAILGMGRDSYYDEFSPNKMKVALRIITPVRKKMVVINYVRTKESDISNIRKGKFENYQARLEILLPRDADHLRYRVYLHLTDETLLKELKTLLERGESRYSLYLGISEFLGWAEFIGEYDARPAKAKEVHTVVPYSLFSRITLDRNLELLIEKMPHHMENKGDMRVVAGTSEYLSTNGGGPLNLKEPVEVWNIGGENAIWM